MPDHTQPALSPEEWKAFEVDDGDARYDATYSHRLFIKPHGGNSFEARERHGLAALCLYQQPFGFTHEDVKAIRGERIMTQATIQACGGPERSRPELLAQLKRLESLELRISFLLPPED